jgi:hypothetical protein
MRGGFTRRTADGGSIQGDAIDWFAEWYERAVERSYEIPPLDFTKVHDPNAPKEPGGAVGGVWEWRSDKPDSLGRRNEGVLAFLQTGRFLGGVSIVDQPLAENADDFKAVRSVRTIQGIVDNPDAKADEEITFQFEVYVDRFTTIRSEVRLLRDRKTLRGKSTVLGPVSGDKRLLVEYTWEARRLL